MMRRLIGSATLLLAAALAFSGCTQNQDANTRANNQLLKQQREKRERQHKENVQISKEFSKAQTEAAKTRRIEAQREQMELISGKQDKDSSKKKEKEKPARPSKDSEQFSQPDSDQATKKFVE
jgi:hypothetical protein